jgi:hypothetical protein
VITSLTPLTVRLNNGHFATTLGELCRENEITHRERVLMVMTLASGAHYQRGLVPGVVMVVTVDDGREAA